MPFDLRSQKQSSCETPNTLKSSNNEIENILTQNNQNNTRSSERDDIMKNSSPNDSRHVPNDTLQKNRINNTKFDYQIEEVDEDSQNQSSNS